MGLPSFHRSIAGVVKIDGSWNTKASFTRSLGSLIFFNTFNITLLPKDEVTGYQLSKHKWENVRKSGRLLVAHSWRWEKEEREGCDGVSAWRAKMVMYDLDSQNIRYISHHSSESAPRFYILYFMFNISRPSSKSGSVFFYAFWF